MLHFICRNKFRLTAETCSCTVPGEVRRKSRVSAPKKEAFRWAMLIPTPGMTNRRWSLVQLCCSSSYKSISSSYMTFITVRTVIKHTLFCFAFSCVARVTSGSVWQQDVESFKKIGIELIYVLWTFCCATFELHNVQLKLSFRCVSLIKLHNLASLNWCMSW